MKNILKIIFPAMLLMVFLTVSASAQTLKIATVDLNKVFTNYYKTKLAQAKLDDDKAQVYKDENSAVTELKSGEADYKQLLAQVNDQALSAEERDKKKQATDAKLKELQDKKTQLDQYDRSAKERLSDEFQRVRNKILSEIRDAVNAKAKAAGDTLVIDSAAETANTTPFIVYNNAQNDLTDDVIKQLNAAAPINIDTHPASMTASPLLSNPSAK